MADFARLVLVSDTTGLKDARAELNHLTRTGDQTEKRVTSATQRMSAGYRAAAVAVAGLVAAAAGIGKAMQMSQEIVGITNGLRAMGMSTQEAEQALNDIADVAMRTRAPLKETAELYRRVSVAGKDMGASQAEVLRFTENVGLALAASGTSANEASGALLQLSQAMAGGIVRAEEFNSILEGAFPIAQAAADGIDAAGGSVGRLRVLVTEGKVSSEEFFNAILSQTDALEEAFGRTVPTIAQAMTVLGTSIGLVAFGFDDAVGASEGLANAILYVAQGVTTAAEAIGSAKGALDDFLSSIVPLGGEVDSLRVVMTGAAVVITGMYLPAIVSATAATFGWIASLITLRGVLITTGIGALIVAAGVLIDFLVRLREATGSWGEVFGLVSDVAIEVFDRIKRGGALLAEQFHVYGMQISAAFASAFATVVESFASMTSIIADGWNGLMSMMGIESNAQGMGEGLAAELRASADYLGETAGALQTSMNSSWADLTGPLESVGKLRDVLDSTSDSTNDAQREAEELAAAIANMGDAAGSGGGAADKVKEVDDAVKDLGKESDLQSKKLSDFFNSAIQGATSFSGVIENLLSQLSSLLISSGLSGIFGESTFGDLFSFDGGGYTGTGARSGGVDGKGGFPAILHPNETVIDHSKGQSMGGGVVLNFAPVIDARGADASAVARVEQQQRQMAAEFEGRVHGVLRTGRNTRRNKVWSGA